MDTLSGGAVSTFNIPRLHPLYNHLPHFKNHLPHSNPSAAVSKPSKVSNRTTTFTTTPLLINPSHTSLQSKHPSNPHQQASTGYAVALLDAARCHDALEGVVGDVKRLSQWLRGQQLSAVITDPCLGKREKGEILREVVRKGKFQKHLVKLVSLLVEKSKVEILGQVLMEFGRIYDEVVIGCKKTQLVMVSPGVKMEQSQVLGIAKSVQKLTGAEKVTVRQLVHHKMPSLTV